MLCDQHIPTRLKGKFNTTTKKNLKGFNTTTIRPAMTYGGECWPIKKEHMPKMSAAKMQMLRWMCAKTRKDKIRNERFQQQLEVTSKGVEIRETHFRWFVP